LAIMNLKLQLKTNSAQRLQSLIFIAFTILSLLSLGLLTGILNQNFHNRLREDMRDRLRDIVALAALQIDTESHQALTAPEMEGNATYAKVQATLQRICESSPVIYYVYTMRTGPNGELIFVVDAETNPDEIAHLGEIYDSPGDVLAAEYRTLSQPVVEKNFYSDKWGTWLSGYAPFYTSDGQRAGIIGIDIEASQVQAHERRFLLTALIVFLAIIPLILALVWYASQRLSAIAQSTQEALHISEERLDLAMSVANDGMWDWILTTDETFFDTRYYTMAGYEPNEFPGTFAEWEKRVHPQDIDIAKAAIQAFVAEQTSQLDMEFRYQHKDGSWIWIRGRGKIVARDEQTLESLRAANQAPLRYVDPATGEATEQYPANPNGSPGGIAALTDPTGRLFGLMPHPEAFLERTNHPRWTRERLPAEGDGLALFRNAVEFISSGE